MHYLISPSARLGRNEEDDLLYKCKSETHGRRADEEGGTDGRTADGRTDGMAKVPQVIARNELNRATAAADDDGQASTLDLSSGGLGLN